MYTTFAHDCNDDEDNDNGDIPGCVDGCNAELTSSATQLLVSIYNLTLSVCTFWPYYLQLQLPPLAATPPPLTNWSLNRSDSLTHCPHLPQHLWASEYIPPLLNPTYSIESLKEEDINWAGARTYLIIFGSCIAECADHIMIILKGCVDAGSFNKVLASSCSFIMYVLLLLHLICSWSLIWLHSNDANNDSKSSGDLNETFCGMYTPSTWQNQSNGFCPMLMDSVP